ncbi:helix-hairpin-helix domain-containing protein [Streptomyces coffeae]|uniref:ATP-binding domain-containing protein n=1 Tax=Streptomyces coffeae TaxID=621382 RepID=A0ABS1NQK5_9ACTN|nr:ATP-binding domain-containing protein [Streptomyces coffeae]
MGATAASGDHGPAAGGGSASPQGADAHTGGDADAEGSPSPAARAGATTPEPAGTGAAAGAGNASGEAGTDTGAEAEPGADASAGGDAEGASSDTAGPGREGTDRANDRTGLTNAGNGPAPDRASAGAAAGTDSGNAAAAAATEGRRSAAAEALAAAVRAVESGERSAASFFNEPAPTRRPAPSPAPAAPRPQQARADAPGGGGVPTGPGPGGVVRAAPRPVRGPDGEIAGAADVRQVLAAGGAPETLAGRVAEVLGERAAEALREDPWQLLAVPGVRHDQADGFARGLLGPDCRPDDERRARALTGWLLERAALEGHTALESGALRSALAKVAVPDPDEALRTVIADGEVLVFQDALDTPGAARPATAEDEEDAEQPVRVLLGLDRYALAEESLADGLARVASTFTGPSSPPEGSADDAGADEPGTGEPSAPGWEKAAAAAPSPSASELIRTVGSHGLVTHSGGEVARAEPAALVAAARALGLRAYAAAHSENGRRRLAALIDTDPSGAAAPSAVTVAGLLSGGEGPGRDEAGALALDLLAVLDAPQLDVETAAMLVESLPDGARLVLSGDPGVLWSAGPGRVFADLLAARRCPQVVSRTPDPGPIGELVSGIGIGELNQVEAPGKEVVIVPARDAGEAVHRTVQLVADSVPRAIGVPAEQTQVITPGHGGAAGTRALNSALKNRLNPGPGRFGGFDPGDRVAYTPAPGRTVLATVVSADADGLRLDCAGTPVVVGREEVGELLRHGWAITAHQAAGSRWPAAVVVLPGDAASALTRAWVYTAFSRGERHLSVVHGVDAALPRAVAEIPFKDRTTRLRALLEAQVPPAG